MWTSLKYVLFIIVTTVSQYIINSNVALETKTSTVKQRTNFTGSLSVVCYSICSSAVCLNTQALIRSLHHISKCYYVCKNPSVHVIKIIFMGSLRVSIYICRICHINKIHNIPIIKFHIYEGPIQTCIKLMP